MPKIERRVYLVLQAIVLVLMLRNLWHELNRMLTTDSESAASASGDFFNVWIAGQVVSIEGAAAVYDASRIHQFVQTHLGFEMYHYVWPYPPSLNFVVIPLGHMPFELAYVIWGSISIALLALATWYAFGRSTEATLFVVLTPAVAANLDLGQTGALFAAPLVLGLLLLERRPLLAGILIGLVTIKPQLGLLIPFALVSGGYWRSFWAACITAITLIFASGAFFGWGAWSSFFSSALVHQVEWTRDTTDFVRIFVPTVTMSLKMLGWSGYDAYIGQTVACLAMIMVVIWAFRQSAVLASKVAVLLVAGILATPYGHIYDMVAMSAGLYVMLMYCQEMPLAALARGVLLLGWILPGLVVLFHLGAAPVAPLFLLALLAIGVCIVYRQSHSDLSVLNSRP